MFSSSASTVSKAYSSVSSSFLIEEAGTMVVKIFSSVQEAYSSSSSSSSSESSSSSYDSGSLISSVITVIEEIISSSSIETSSFKSGVLIVDVTMGIIESIMKSTISADSGRVIEKVIKTLNVDIDKSEAGSSHVDQPALFKKVATVIKDAFEEDSEITPSKLMVKVASTVNEELGSSVSKETETLKLYVNTLKAVYHAFKDLTSLTEQDEKEAKIIIRTLNVFSNIISSSVDAGDIAVATITALVTFNDGNSFKSPEIQGTIDVIKDLLKDQFGSRYFNTDEGIDVSRGITKTVMALYNQ